jgi:sulfur relay (sulfurtransferase) DsrC/TusE family protein
MPTTTIAGVSVDVNDEGFLTNPDQWSHELGAELAKLVGVDMSDAHWAIIDFLRKPGRDRHAAPGEHAGRSAGQGVVRPLPRQTGQEDVVCRRAAQAEGLCLR